MREYIINSNSHQIVNEMKGNYIGLMDYFAKEELPEFEVTVKNILRKSLSEAHRMRIKKICIDDNNSLDKFVMVFENKR